MLPSLLMIAAGAALVDANILPTPPPAVVTAASTPNTHHTLQVAVSAPSAAVDVPPDFFSFGFETAFLTHFHNKFSENVVGSIANRTSKPLIIRVGGTSGDLVSFNESQKEPARCFSGHGCRHASDMAFTLGPSYFEGFKAFPNAHMTFQAPIYPKLEMKDWLNRSMEYTRRASKALGQSRIAGIALGNEPDYYTYGPEEYIDRAVKLESRIVKELGLTGEARRIFELGDIPNSVIAKRDEDEMEERGFNFGVSNILGSELDKNGMGKFAAQHYYQIEQKHLPATRETMQNHLMNHKAITARFPRIDRSIEYVQTHAKDIAYVISETGSAIGSLPLNISGSFGAALWAVDFHLYAMTRGVKRVSNTMRPEATHGFWVPDDTGAPMTLGPAVHGIFPAAAFITDFIGKDSLGKAAVIDVPGNPDFFSAYGMYERQSGALKRAALVNLNFWDESVKGHRGNATVTLHVGDTIKSATVRRMRADNGATALGYDLGGHKNNVTWAGEQWTYKLDRGVGHSPHPVKKETVSVNKAGDVVVTVPDSEAVMVTFA
ncbi:uncharacterized protein N7459_007066 [Penicillium hispanicum]|uniref:uncharacterized protein n=1 Tax=Penicillium hispanicum TaxID=1080232 RepID=UPI00253F6713|nr:uncharacterized protein N7459_007066 [Penicillium hispanicum]KAJ5578102.1 hypothetical protein N7459_007066 [Penicillium hispanicum]